MKVDLSQHRCRTLVFSCIDFRFGHAIRHAIGKITRPFFAVAMAGGSKAITDTDTREAALKQIKLAKTLGGAEVMLLVDHVNCKMFGGHESEADHVKNLLEAKGIIEQAVDVKVIPYLGIVKPNGDFKLQLVEGK